MKLSGRLLSVLAVLLAVGIMTGCTQDRLIKINGSSMEPTLHDGQKIVASPISASELKRGDLVYYKDNSNGNTYVKRLIGLPGETVEISNGLIYIDGKELKENYGASAPSYAYGPLTLQNDEYFVLGDNRDDSYDSHISGAIRGSQILGKITQILQ